MKQVIEIFLSNPVPFTILGLILTVLGLTVAYRKLIVSDKSLEIAKSKFESEKSKFNLYLEDSFRLNIKGNRSSKYLLFNIRINNFSTTKNTFSPLLTIEYYDKEHTKSKIKINHQPSHKNKIPQKDITIMGQTIRIEEKDIKSGWVIFEQPKSLSNKRIEKYSVSMMDSHKNSAVIDTFLIKDIVHEI